MEKCPPPTKNCHYGHFLPLLTVVHSFFHNSLSPVSPSLALSHLSIIASLDVILVSLLENSTLPPVLSSLLRASHVSKPLDSSRFHKISYSRDSVVRSNICLSIFFYARFLNRCRNIWAAYGS